MTVRCENCAEQSLGTCDRFFDIAASSLSALTTAAVSIPDVGLALDFGQKNKQVIADGLSEVLGKVGCGLSNEQIEFRLQQEIEEL